MLDSRGGPLKFKRWTTVHPVWGVTSDCYMNDNHKSRISNRVAMNNRIFFIKNLSRVKIFLHAGVLCGLISSFLITCLLNLNQYITILKWFGVFSSYVLWSVYKNNCLWAFGKCFEMLSEYPITLRQVLWSVICFLRTPPIGMFL